jgi:hypothetical protein
MVQITVCLPAEIEAKARKPALIARGLSLSGWTK